MEKNIMGLPSTILDSSEWKEMEAREYAIGPDNLMSELIDKKLLSNVEIMWLLKRMVFFYGSKDSLLKIVPIERLLTNMNDILRAFYILFDQQDPELDDNLRSYISTKLADSTFGINARTREYLAKFN